MLFAFYKMSKHTLNPKFSIYLRIFNSHSLSMCILWSLWSYHDLFVYTLISMCILWSPCVSYDPYVYTMISMMVSALGIWISSTTSCLNLNRWSSLSRFANADLPSHECVDVPRSSWLWVLISVTRLGDLLHFGQLFKACGNNHFTQIAHIFRDFLWRCQNLWFF